MQDYYELNNATVANSSKLFPNEGETQHFPSEGLYFGSLSNDSGLLPALFDLNAGKGFCIMYGDSDTREQANRCIERMVWRIAMSVPSNLCDLIFFNGGRPGESFDTLSHLNRNLFHNGKKTVYYDGNLKDFSSLLEDIYTSIASRMSIISIEGENSLYKLHACHENDVELKYQFIVLTDFPRSLTIELGELISKIIEAGNRAGIYVLMSWDINADFAGCPSNDTQFIVKKMLASLEMIVPKGGRYYFKNSQDDVKLNMLRLTLDSDPVDHITATKLLDRVDGLVEHSLEAAKPKILKPNFAGIRDSSYFSELSDINVTVGKDIHDKSPVSISFNSKDFIHGFIIGQSGSGKSVLLNSIITSAILKYSPRDLMLYLMDFKGVEFNCYRGIKHSKAVLVDSDDPQMTLEVLRELLEEDKHRRKLWIKEGVKNIDGYNGKHPDGRLPHILFVADECQAMFKQPSNDSERVISNEISEILVHIAKIGRSQGIHMLLATQQLGEVNIHNDILENLTECFILRCAARDSERLVPGSSDITGMQATGIACYYHQKKLVGQVQTFYASDEELKAAISDSQQKAVNFTGNGAHYFSGSSEFSLSDPNEIAYINEQGITLPTAFIGRNLGIHTNPCKIPLGKDFSENILFIGANGELQTTGVAVSALQTLVMSYERLGIRCDFKVIDCYGAKDEHYRKVLDELQDKGKCEVIDRHESGSILKQLADALHRQEANPVVLVILGSERFVEMKRNTVLEPDATKGFNSSSQVVNMDFFCDENGSTEGFEEQIEGESTRLASMDFGNSMDESNVRTYPDALRCILDEGPIQDIHVLLQVDKPTNILFEDYPDETVSMFKHKVILKSENKNLAPMRFSIDIDVECLCDQRERLRAYYYPENGFPQLFTPYLLTQD